jgi:flagellar protein FlaG
MGISNTIASLIPTGKAGAQRREVPATGNESARQAAAAFDKVKVEAAIARANQRLERQQGRQIAFAWDTEARKVVVTVRDPKTEEVIRQVPTEQAMDLARRLERSLARIDEKA